MQLCVFQEASNYINDKNLYDFFLLKNFRNKSQRKILDTVKPLR